MKFFGSFVLLTLFAANTASANTRIQCTGVDFFTQSIAKVTIDFDKPHDEYRNKSSAMIYLAVAGRSDVDKIHGRVAVDPNGLSGDGFHEFVIIGFPGGWMSVRSADRLSGIGNASWFYGDFKMKDAPCKFIRVENETTRD